VDRAIEIARLAGLPLKVAAKVDPADQTYFEREIAQLLELPFVEFLGEVGETEKERLLGGARAMLFPIDWREPFGLVMIEAMACGTPTIAWREGSVPEVITPGVSGFIVDSVEEAVDAIKQTQTMDRRRVRQAFEDRFTADRMARDYVALYEALVGDQADRASALHIQR